MAEGVGAEVEEEGAPEVVAEDLPVSSGSPEALWPSPWSSFLAGLLATVGRLGEGVDAVVS
jgi:hypothetical protein